MCVCVFCLILILACFIFSCLLTDIGSVKCVYVCMYVCVCTLLVCFLETLNCMVGICDQAIHICEGWLHVYFPYLHFGETARLSHMLEIFFFNLYYRPYAVDSH